MSVERSAVEDGEIESSAPSVGSLPESEEDDSLTWENYPTVQEYLLDSKDTPAELWEALLKVSTASYHTYGRKFNFVPDYPDVVAEDGTYRFKDEIVVPDADKALTMHAAKVYRGKELILRYDDEGFLLLEYVRIEKDFVVVTPAVSQKRKGFVKGVMYETMKSVVDLVLSNDLPPQNLFRKLMVSMLACERVPVNDATGKQWKGILEYLASPELESVLPSAGRIASLMLDSLLTIQTRSVEIGELPDLVKNLSLLERARACIRTGLAFIPQPVATNVVNLDGTPVQRVQISSLMDDSLVLKSSTQITPRAFSNLTLDTCVLVPKERMVAKKGKSGNLLTKNAMYASGGDLRKTVVALTHDLAEKKDEISPKKRDAGSKKRKRSNGAAKGTGAKKKKSKK